MASCATACLVPAGAAAAPSTRLAVGARAVSGGTWGTAREVPGTAALNAGGQAQVGSVSCASAGNCTAAGSYTDSSGHTQAFVVSQVRGTWGTADEVPGTATLNTGGNAVINSLSCGSAGNCSAAGSYTDSSLRTQAFAISQVGGTWGTAEEVPGSATLEGAGGGAAIDSVSCASPGNCSAGGYYDTKSATEHPLVVSQVHGTWGKAHAIPVGVGHAAAVTSVSCASAGNCSAGGYYDFPGLQAFVISQVHSTWGTAKVVPRPGTGTGGYALVTSVSCASAGNCSGAGSYTDSSLHTQAFVVSQAGGTWGTAEEVPGTATLNNGGNDAINSLSCGSAGNCSAAGSYTDSSGRTQAFAVSQVGGTWGTTEEVPGTAALNTGGNAAVSGVSCPSASNCSAGGTYQDRSGHQQAFVVSQVNGKWGTAEEVPGTAALNTGGNAGIGPVSCTAAGNCSASGSYTDRSGHLQAFIVNQT